MYLTSDEHAKREYIIPVEWSVFDTVTVQANSLEEAYKYVTENADDIPLGDDPTYIDGSYKISADNVEECLLYQDVGKIQCLDFRCDENLKQYTDSMLFDSGTNIAYGKFIKGNEELEIFLDVRGEVVVDYKDEVYHCPSEFPDELKELIRNNPNQWMTNEDVYVNFNNWFEYIYDSDGDVYEADVSEGTPEMIREDMEYLAEEYFSRKEKSNG